MKHYNNPSAHAVPILILLVICLMAVFVASSPAEAETYIYKDADGVYRTGKDPKVEARERQKAERTTEQALDKRVENLHEGLRNEPVVPPELFEFYKTEYLELVNDINGSSLSWEKVDSYRERIDGCREKLKAAGMTEPLTLRYKDMPVVIVDTDGNVFDPDARVKYSYKQLKAEVEGYCKEMYDMAKKINRGEPAMIGFTGNLKKDISESDLSWDEKDRLLKEHYTCSNINARLSRSEMKGPKVVSLEENEDFQKHRRESRFKELSKEVAKRYDKRRTSGVTEAREGFRRYWEFEGMLEPLTYGMTKEKVLKLWGKPVYDGCRGSIGSGKVKYGMGVGLRFSNGKLEEWFLYRR